MASRSQRGRRATANAAPPRAGRRAALLGRRSVRAFVAHEHRSAALLLALLVLVYLWPALVQGHVLAPTALLWLEPPWQSLAPRGVERWINGDLGDVPYAYYAWDVLARRLIHAGTFPAWNPYAFGGTPLWANSQIAWLSPFSLPLWILPLNYGLGVAAALKLWVAGFGTYLLSRELRLGFWPGVVAGVAFVLCSFNVVWLSYGVFVSVAATLPWALWLGERIARRGRALDGLVLAGVLTVALTGGHPGTQVHVLAATVLYALVRVATLAGVERRDRGLRLALVGAGLLVALLAAAVVLLPAERAAADTVGAAARAHGAPRFAGSLMPFDVLRTALFPEWWGRPSEGVSAGPGPAGYRERTFYAGTATLVLAFVALLAPGGWRRKAPFALIGFLGLAIALRLPVLYDVVIRLPGFDRVQNSRIYLWFVLAAAVLGGFGLQRLLDARGRLGRGWLALAAALLAAVAAVASIGPGGSTWSAALEHAVRRTRTADATVLSLASALTWLAFAVALAAIVLLVRRRPRAAGVAGALVALVVVLDMLHFANGYQPIGPISTVLPKPTPAVAYLQRHRDAGRIAAVQSMGADWSTLYGLRDVRGFDSPLPTFRFFRLWQLMDPTADPYSLNSFTELSPRVLGLLGARWILFPPGTQGGGNDVKRVYEGRDATVVENRLAAPRAFVAGSVRVVSGPVDELASIEEEGFDPRRVATLRAGEIDGPPPAGTSGSARLVTERNASVTLRASLPRRGLVVLDDTWAPGWSVEVDGREAQALQANVVLRGVVVPAGTHEIVWRYRVPGLRAGAALSAVGLLAGLAWAGALVARSRRTRQPPRSTKPRPLSSAT
jgi:hypothetical protein